MPFLLKPLAIFFIVISSISAYFMQAYGVIIDKGMLLNVLHTDTREAFSYFNVSLAIWLIFVTILPCVYVALVKISYGSFKSALRSRVKIALSTLASAAIIFALMSKIFIPFFREPQRLNHKRFTPILSYLLWHKISKVFTAKTAAFYLRGR
ncbi:phosphoethanolamine transferase domain-containing protein [Campylobacter concisus]